MTDGVIIVGASGFGRETADVLEAMGVPIHGILDDNPSDQNLARLRKRGLQFVGTVDGWLMRAKQPANYLIGIGNGRVRELIAAKLDQAGHIPFTAIHPSATIGGDTVVGPGTVICTGARISTNVTLGRHVHLNPNAVVGHDSTLDDFVSMNPTSNVSGECTVGRCTMIGAGSTILQKLTIGAESVIGASALVTKDTPDRVVAKGVPARWSPRT